MYINNINNEYKQKIKLNLTELQKAIHDYCATSLHIMVHRLPAKARAPCMFTGMKYGSS